MLSRLVESVEKAVHTVGAMQLPDAQSSFGFLLVLMQARANVLLLMLLLFTCSIVLISLPCFFHFRLSVCAI